MDVFRFDGWLAIDPERLAFGFGKTKEEAEAMANKQLDQALRAEATYHTELNDTLLKMLEKKAEKEPPTEFGIN